MAATGLDQATFEQQAAMLIMASMMKDASSNYNVDALAARAWAGAQALWTTTQGNNPQGGDSTDTGSTTVDDDT